MHAAEFRFTSWLAAVDNFEKKAKRERKLASRKETGDRSHG